MKSGDNRIAIELPKGLKLVAEQNVNPEYQNEIYVTLLLNCRTILWTKFAHTAPHTMILWNRWLLTTVFVERCRLWQNVFLSSLVSTTWSLMQNKKVKARQLNSYTNG